MPQPTSTEQRGCERPVIIEDRADDKAPMIVGYAAVFDALSENLGGFREMIAPGAFDAVLDDDVRAVINHEPSLILGRTKAGTLTISQDTIGLRYSVEAPGTSYANDFLLSARRGDITQSSFRFQVDQDDWAEDEDGRIIRTIRSFKRLLDVSPVTYPAYPDATVAVRALEQFQEQNRRGLNKTRAGYMLDIAAK